MALKAEIVHQNQIGYFRIFAKPPGGSRSEITIFRGAPIIINNFATTDPFTESTASLTMNQVTAFDNPGHGDLDWLVPDCDIDLVWQNYGPYDYEFRWEGFITTFQYAMGGTDSNFSIDLKGALYALDNYLAKPTFPKSPVPFEVLIQNAFNPDTYPARLKPLKVTFPAHWNTFVPEYTGPKYYRSTLKPAGVTPGQKWTGLTSRNTGSWEPILSGYVQSLLSTMFDEGGSQWCIRNNGNRTPELFLRRPPFEESNKILEVTLGAPGVTFEATRDFSQRADVIFGQGKDEAGITFSGMAATPDGTATYFKPYAYSPLVYPQTHNPIKSNKAVTKETMIRFTDGLDELAATRVAEGQLQRFLDPGFVGSLALLTDPLDGNGEPFPRMLIQAGTTIRIRGVMGFPMGLLVHVTEASVDVNALQTSLTFDSKYRDVLTVDEVKARNRDALSPLRSLQVGKFSNSIQDLMAPWNYREGSGMIPVGSKELFMEKVPADAEFPYEEWTTKFPPKDYPQYYIKIGPTDTTDALKNWSTSLQKYPIRMSFGGSIKLTEIAAYDRLGNIVPVRFHVSFYTSQGTDASAMPKFWQNPDIETWLKPAGISVTYAVGQAYPFIKDAWEQIRDTGETAPVNPAMVVAEGAGFVVGWGNYYEPAGYSPGRFSRGSARTGRLTDETQWSWDLSQNYSKNNRDAPPLIEHSDSLWIEIYCDEQDTEPVFFLGRLWRQEPGTS